MERYWVKLWRKSVDSQAFQNEGLWKVWSWCLMKANHAEAWFPLETGRGTTEVHLQPGQFLFGRKVAARELKMAESTVWGRMRKLEKMGNIAIKSDTHYSIITIRNWFKYQSTKNENRQPSNNQATTNRHKQ